MKREHILLPCLGNPLQEVWLPSKGGFDALTIPIPPITARSVTQLAADYAESLGIRERATPPFGDMRIGNKLIYTVILWLKPGDTPKKLQRVPIKEALVHPNFGPIVTSLSDYLASRR